MYVCRHCYQTSEEYKGQCFKCSRWNCFEERDLADIPVPVVDETCARPITDVKSVIDKRFSTGIAEFDRVLGTSAGVSGIVYPSLVMLAGDPGIGKSTILLQSAANVARDVGPVIYATGEENDGALASRAERLDAKHERLFVMVTHSLEKIEAEVRKVQPRLLIVDSTQTVGRSDLSGEPGSIAQVKGLPPFLRPLANARGHEMAIIIVGHVTKDGVAAGPRTVEHLVDALMYFEGEKGRQIRFLRCPGKNRFNNTQDVGVLEMTDIGLVDVASPSAHFLAQRRADHPGTVVTSMCSGTNNRRALLVELQVLFGTSELSKVDVSVSGLDKARVVMMCAVIARNTNIQIENTTLHAQAMGGLDVSERAADLPIALAIASAARGHPVHPDMVIFGEVGFMGELRDTPQVQVRLKEAAAMGFRRALVPPFKGLEGVEGIELVRAETLGEAIEMALVV